MTDTPPRSRPGNQTGNFDIVPLIDDAQVCRLGVGFMVIGWFHLIIFAACEGLFLRGDRAPAHFLPLWTLDVILAVFVIRRCLLPINTFNATHSIRVVIRIGLTFAILCLTSASLNSITGFQVDWFKISWAMLGTFGFAMLAWIFHLAFLIPAVFMSLTALLIASYPDHAYAIFGISWFIVLQVFGSLLEWHRIREWFGLASSGSDRITLKHRSQNF